MDLNFGGMSGITADSFLHKDSDIFALENYEKSVLKTVEHTYSTNADLSSDGPYRFSVDRNSTSYIKARDIRLLMEFNITQHDGTALTSRDEVSFENLPISSLFESVSVELYNSPVTTLTQEAYNYKCMLSTMLSYDYNNLHNILTNFMYYEDPLGFYDSTDVTKGTWRNFKSSDAANDEAKDFKVEKDNLSFGIWRRASEARSGTVQVIAPLWVDFFQTNRLLPPDTPFALTFQRNQNKDFYLLSMEPTKKYKLTITKFEMKVPFVELAPSLHATLESHLKTHTAKYKFQNTVVIRKQIQPGGTDLSFDSCIDGPLPKQLYFVMIDTSAFNGNIKESPYVFRHNNVSSLHLKINQEMIPLEPIKYDFSDTGLSRNREGYNHFLKQIGQSHLGANPMITPKAFLRDRTIFCFDLTSDQCGSYHLHQVIQGKLDIKMQLSTPLVKATTLLVFAIYEKILTINNQRQITIDYV